MTLHYADEVKENFVISIYFIIVFVVAAVIVLFVIALSTALSLSRMHKLFANFVLMQKISTFF